MGLGMVPSGHLLELPEWPGDEFAAGSALMFEEMPVESKN